MRGIFGVLLGCALATTVPACLVGPSEGTYVEPDGSVDSQPFVPPAPGDASGFDWGTDTHLLPRDTAPRPDTRVVFDAGMDVVVGPRWWTFELPADAVPNHNGSIGPFCCTGRTATIKNLRDAPIGYAYFFSFGDAYNYGGTAIAGKFKLLVAGSTNLDDPSAPLVQSEIDLDASEMEIGLERSTRAGQLVFTITIEDLDFILDRYDMGTLKMKLQVAPIL